MFEFITVSNKPERIPALERSIHAAMAGFTNTSGGRVWRLTVMDGNQHDVFSGYNAGVAQTAGDGGDILCFLHHDVVLMANAVAFEKPLALLNDATTGVVGVAGATRLNAGGTWWGDLPQQQVMSFCRGAVGCPDNAAPNVFGMNTIAWPGGQGVYGRVLVVDGVFLMMHRARFNAVGGFDGGTFKGFHFYDIDLSLKAHFAGLRNYVAPLAMFHGSTGTYDAVWEGARQVFVRKWGGKLPLQLM